jgi:signal transduction histidine kinase
MSPRRAWTAYAASVLVAALALVALTQRALEADRAEATARQQAAVEENVRLALWRIDSAVGALVARETANVRRTRPLPPVRAAFVVDASGRSRVVSAAPAKAEGVSFDIAALASRLPAVESVAAVGSARQPDPEQFADQRVQTQRNIAEFQARQTSANVLQQQVLNQVQADDAPPDAPPLAPLAAVWVGDQIVLARRIASRPGVTEIEGCVLDWQALRAELLASIVDLLPHAGLEPAPDADPAHEQRLLAAIPARLVPGDVAQPTSATWSPLRGSLVAAWVAMAVAAAALAALLASVLALAERRAAFVSSVTHELRTPLTTFRLYSGMLEEGMVPEEEIQGCHTTLRREADRLTHLVENVLAYAGLERGRHASRTARVPVAELLARTVARPAERAEGAGFTWRIDVGPDAADAVVIADPAAVEQVLFNLVDNACKYARGGTPAEIELAVGQRGTYLALAVRDHGPGIAPREAARLFEAFRKSARDAAEGGAGVGLGLALSRRLARQMGGDLVSDPPADGGARFVLTLPLAKPLAQPCA